MSSSKSHTQKNPSLSSKKNADHSPGNRSNIKDSAEARHQEHMKRQAEHKLSGVVEGHPGIIESTHIDPLSDNE